MFRTFNYGDGACTGQAEMALMAIMAINKLNRFLFSTALAIFFSALAGADTITGKVFNQTTSQPAPGDDVVLLQAGNLTQEQAHTKTDAQGAFTFNDTDAKGVYVVRVLHQGVNYDRNVVGVSPLDIKIFDTVPKIAGLSGSIGMARIEPDKAGLRVTEAYAIANASSPPVTQAGGPNIEISLPANAVLDWLQVLDNGNWTIRSALPVKGQDGHYAASVPFRPGNTFYKFSYHLPYKGSAAFHLKASFPIQKFAVSLPPALALKPAQAGTFKAPGMAEGLQVYPTMGPISKDVPAFVVSNSPGTVRPPAASNIAPPPAAAVPPAASARRPDASPAIPPMQAPQEQSRQEFWPILILISVLVAVGLFGLWRMRRNAIRAAVSPGSTGQPSALDALKEELFKLESDRLGGSISAEEYESAKSALTQNIHRAMERK